MVQSFKQLNPSLWTLKIEVMFYLTVPVWMWIYRRSGIASSSNFILGLSTFYFLWLDPTNPGLAKQHSRPDEILCCRHDLPSVDRGFQIVDSVCRGR